MLKSDLFYEDVKRRFIDWVQRVEDIRAAVVVGSRACENHPADEWSDMDIVFYSTNPNQYFENQEWLKNMGDIRVSCVSQTAGGDRECLTLFGAGRQVDFVIHSLDSLQYCAENQIIPDNFFRGVKVLLDKDHLTDGIIPDFFKVPEKNPLSEEMFTQLVNLFWFGALYIAKQILRNELWVAKARDNELKSVLLQMIEWHEQVIHGVDYDTWHAGRFICEWASEETLTELQDTFGHFDQKDSWKALQSTITLFSRLSHDIANRMQYGYPNDLEECAIDWVSQNDMTTLSTERLVLRRWNEEDAESLYEYAKDPDIGPIAGWPPHKSIDESLDIIRNVFNGSECYAICEKGNNKAIGAVELKLNGHTDMTDSDDECELGYWIGKPFWGRGYMPEAAKELIRHGFEDLGMTTIWCGYYDGNSKSKRVQEKAGFVYHHTCDDVPVPLMNETRIGHTNYMTKEQWVKSQTNPCK